MEGCGPTCEHPCGQQSAPGKTRKTCGKGKGLCPADIESRLKEYSDNTQNLVCCFPMRNIRKVVG
ncbi:hypothetical protein NQ314_009598 [Rhamnusium bicolor]|uniref:Uncharacterized protein n=1 Tax=Rhamnusium bicolor TaxID=1586634 RepID=A0AAV8XZL5_9CUCU|nr:hypothetical protein NQ314_009598 [Rhamnusium bicolor]